MSNFKTRGTKFLLLMLALAFVLSSISGVILSMNRYNILTVAGEKVGLQEFYNILNRERESQYRNSSNSELTAKYLASQQFARDTLSKLVEQKIVEKEIKESRLLPPTSQVIDEMVKDKFFAKDGKDFDMDVFQNFIKSSSITEDEYLNLLKQLKAGQFLSELLSGGNVLNEKALAEITKLNNEYRNITLYSINVKDIKIEDLPTPTEEEKKEYYNRHINDYRKSEKRKINYIALTPQQSALSLEERMKKIYQENLEEFTTNRSNNIYVLESKDKENMLKIKENFEAGENILALAKKYLNQEELDILNEGLSNDSLGYLFGDEAKSLKLGELSEIQEKDGYFTMVYLKSINEPKTLTFAEAKPRLLDMLEEEKERKELDAALVEKIEELLLTADNLEEIADKLKVKENTLGYLTADNLEKVKGLENPRELFEYRVNDFSNLVVKDNVYYIYSVVAIEPAVVPDYKDLEKTIETALLNEMKEAKYMDVVLEKFVNAKTKTPELKSKNLVLYKDNKDYSHAFVLDVFNRKIGTTTGVYRKANELYFASVNSVGQRKTSSTDYISQDTIAQELDASIKQSINEEFLKHLKRKYKTKINYKLLDLLN